MSKKRSSLSIVNEIINIRQDVHGDKYLQELVENISKLLDIKYVFIGHDFDGKFQKVQTDIVWVDDNLVENFIYELKDTPCEIVLSGKRVCIHQKNVIKTFPKDLLLQEMGVESYVGAPILFANSDKIGLLVLLDDKPMEDKELFYSITEFLALRVAVELERTHMEKILNAKIDDRTLELERANIQIEKINKTLKKRVKEEIEINKKNQKIINQQSKMVVMGEMIENIAHQWRQPLSTIITASNAIKLKNEMGSLNDKFLHDAMDIIIDSGKHLSQTIDDFRSFYKLEKEKDSFSIKDTIQKTLKLMNSRLYANVEVILDLEDCTINGFSNEFIQVIMNILGNACDQFEALSGEKYIFITSKIEDDEFILYIKDNAQGIDESIIYTIFDAYVTTKENSGGTGIGLHMSKEIIENHMEGFLGVKNVEFDYKEQKYKGAEFFIRIPI
jgi:signal transduction histidine kinase